MNKTDKLIFLRHPIMRRKVCNPACKEHHHSQQQILPSQIPWVASRD
jgi:hypothetical protein